MSIWYSRVTADPENVMPLLECIDFFDNELLEAKKEIKIHGNLEKQSAQLPGIFENRFSQLQEIESILEYLNIRLRKVRHAAFKKYLETYNRELSSRDADRYADADDSVMQLALLINQFALTRNYYLGIMKGLEAKSFQINNITKLRTAGMEDVTIDTD
jgi:hypothetical protein